VSGKKASGSRQLIQEFSGIEKIVLSSGRKTRKIMLPRRFLRQKKYRSKSTKKTRRPEFFVAPEELSLAIGKDGQNLRLASKINRIQN